jgi:mono/diheme cytochrome c family protein
MCKSCHGENGRGVAAKATVLKIEPKLLDLARPEAATLTLDERREALLHGKGKMPAYGKKLKPEEIDPLLAYAAELAKAAPKAE